MGDCILGTPFGDFDSKATKILGFHFPNDPRRDRLAPGGPDQIGAQ